MVLRLSGNPHLFKPDLFMKTETDQGPLLPVNLCVLAGGLSRRMGATNKLLLSYQGQPMVRHVVSQALVAQCGPVRVITGHDAGAIQEALYGLPVAFVHNPDYAEGQAASVRVAASIDPQAALMVLLADMPRVDVAVILALVLHYRQSVAALGADADHVVVRPQNKGKPGNPVLWGPAWLPRLAQLQGDEGARVLLSQSTVPVSFVSVDTEGIFADIDQPSDLPAFDMRLPC